jgi:hypothetical protein
MKKILSILAAAICASAFAPQACAIPSFSRQTGMACHSCHAQHGPILNGFGQAFKAAGYPMLGAQTKVEGEGLSIPRTLSPSLVLKAQFQKSNGKDTDAIPGDSTNSGQWRIPEELSVFFGGRIADQIGFYLEGNTTANQLISGFKLPVVYNFEIAKASVIPYMTDTQGASYGYEQASTGAVRNIRWAEHRREISAQQYVGTDGAATGVAFVAQNDIGYINFSRWAPGFMARSGEAQTFRSSYLRIAATPTINSTSMGDWATHVGLQFWGGSNYAPTLLAAPAPPLVEVDTRAVAFDFQAFGQFAGRDTSLYATWAKAPGGTPSKPNILNAGNNVANGTNPVGPADPSLYRVNDRKAFTIGAEHSLIQHKLHVGAAYRRANTGGGMGLSAVAGGNPTDNAITVTFVYSLFQNAEIHLNHSFYSGTLYDTLQPTGTQLTTLALEASW